MSGEARTLRFGMIGSSIGNGHPYSWSAILNGYDVDRMTSECPFPGIPAYLNSEPAERFPHPRARVTHVYCEGDGGFDAAHVAECTNIPHVAREATELIGEVDAVIVATDRGSEHVQRCRPFVEAGIPIFVDKPLVTDMAGLRTFHEWVRDGAPIMSSSSMRYAREFVPFHDRPSELGDLKFVSITSPKSWEAYGIHALEAVYPVLGPGFQQVRNTGTRDRNVVHVTHDTGVDVVAVVSAQMYGALGCMQLGGSLGAAQVQFSDTFTSFRAQLDAFIEFVHTGIRSYPFSETEELMKLVIAGEVSREQGGAPIDIRSPEFSLG